MSLLSVKNLSCEQATKVLFENATFGIEAGDKIAVIGPNGCGKSTLLTLLSKVLDQPVPEVATQNGVSISYLPQRLSFNADHTIQDHLFQSKTPASLALQGYQQCLAAYQEEYNPETEAAFTEASSEMDRLDAWDYEDRVSSILNELHITDMDQKMGDLSGGMLKKISLAQFFFETADLLILDEPTNHLDIVTIEWLEAMLKNSQSALLMVTHDRYFLDKVCTKVFEIDQQQFFVYPGNYQAYLEQRDQRYAAQAKHESSIQSVLRVELAWLRRGPKARSTKQKARKDRIGSMMDRKKITPEQVLSLDVAERRLGKKICVLKDVSKSFEGRPIISSFSYTFKQGERIGILGPNGAGKTTLLNLIMDKLAPDSGEVDVGVNTVFGYFDQHSQDFDLDKTIYEHVSEIGSQIKIHDGTFVSAAKLLEQFLFPSAMLKTPIRKLSGGEKRRLHLVCLLLENPNFLLFDEPTNDLDIQTLSVLELFLSTFKGCVIVISHDRYFMDRVVDQLFIFKPGGQITAIDGTYTDYSDAVKDVAALAKKESAAAKGQAAPDTGRAERQQAEKELKALEKEIARLEAEKEVLAGRLSTEPSHTDAYVKLCKEMTGLDGDLEKALALWETVADQI